MNMEIDGSKLFLMKDTQKGFNGIPVLKEIDFEVNYGENVAVIGSNGTGKLTLMNILAGVHHADGGEIYFEGKKVDIHDPNIAERLRIGMVHQEPSLYENMKVYESIFLSRELKNSYGMLDCGRMREEGHKVVESLGFEMEVDKKVRDINLVSRIIVSVAKTVLMDPKLLILDEVIAALNQKEAKHLFEVICSLRKKGPEIVLISHKIREIVQIYDRVAMLRDRLGAGALNKRTGILNEKDIINLALGEAEWKGEYSQREMADHGETAFLSTQGLSRNSIFQNTTFNICEDGIIGLAGLKGSGIAELMYSIFGIVQYDEGSPQVQGELMKASCPQEAVRRGICMITNDRQGEELTMGLPIKNNILIASLGRAEDKTGLISGSLSSATSKDCITKLQVKTAGPSQQVQFLSGGNQQRVVIAKWLLRDSDVILIDEPTHGIGIKAKNEIYNLLLREKSKNEGIIIYSPKTGELLDVCSQIIVIDGGGIVAEISRADPDLTEKGVLEIMRSYQNK